jgi:D-alanine-D-alanine ligase
VKIVILYDGVADGWSDKDVSAVLGSVRRVADVLRDAGHSVQRVPVRPGLRWLAPCRRADVVVNLCEGVGAVSRAESLVAGTLELTGVPFTGARPEVMVACLRKPMANALLAARGLPVPRWAMPNGNRVPGDFPLPAIVKPAMEDASVGIDQSSVVTTRTALTARVAEMSEQFDEIIVQQYIGGRELAVGFVGDQALPVSEIDFSAMPDGAWPILSFDAKWDPESPEDAGSQPVCPARIPRTLQDKLVGMARDAWRAVGGSGYGRVDFRVDDAGQPWVLEVNPNPDLSEDAGLARMARAFGWSYDELVLRIVEMARADAERTQSVSVALQTTPRSRAEQRSGGRQQPA